MCEAFLKYIFGEENLTYQSTPLLKVKLINFPYTSLYNFLIVFYLYFFFKQIEQRDRDLSFGEFNKLKRVNVNSNIAVQRETDVRYLADRSSLPERRGAVRFRFIRQQHGVLCTSEFSIVVTSKKQLFPLTTVFGYVIQGMDVCDQIGQIHGIPYNNIKIQKCGNWNPDNSPASRTPSV